MCFLSAYLVCTVVSAQDVQLPDTVMTQQLSEVSVVGRSRVSVTRQASPLQLLDNKSIERLGIQELSEAVRRFSGVTIKDYGGIGGLKTVSIRSLGAHHTAVSYDGVSISDAQSGQVDISRFTLDNVDMVSLSTGQSDDIFQTARIYASAGALNIKTRKPTFEEGKPYNLLLKVKGGSFGLLNPVVSYSHKLNNRLSASVYGDYMHADSKYPFTWVNAKVITKEKRLNSDIDALRLEGNLYGDFGRSGNLETKLYTFNSERGLPGWVKNNSEATARLATDRLWNDNSFIQTRYKNQLNKDFSIQAIAKYSYTYSRYKNVNENLADTIQYDRNTQHEFYGSAGVMYTPFQRLSTTLTTDYAYTKLRNNFINSAMPERNTSLTAFAIQYKSSSLTATGSLLGTYVSDEVIYGNRPDDRKHLSPAIALLWQPLRSSALRVRASYKDIFRVPTFTDLYYLRIGNTGLKPEKAKQYNLGLTWSGNIGQKIKYLSISADGYYNKVEDKIVAIPTLYIWKMLNLGEVEIKGADVNISAEIPVNEKINLLLSGNYTYQYAVDITNKEKNNYKHQIPYTPRHSGNGSATIETPWFNMSYILVAVSERYALPENIKNNRVNAYMEQSISLNRTIKLGNVSIRLQGDLLNFTNEQYEVIQNYPMPGRSGRIGVTINL